MCRSARAIRRRPARARQQLTRRATGSGQHTGGARRRRAAACLRRMRARATQRDISTGAAIRPRHRPRRAAEHASVGRAVGRMQPHHDHVGAEVGGAATANRSPKLRSETSSAIAACTAEWRAGRACPMLPRVRARAGLARAGSAASPYAPARSTGSVGARRVGLARLSFHATPARGAQSVFIIVRRRVPPAPAGLEARARSGRSVTDDARRRPGSVRLTTTRSAPRAWAITARSWSSSTRASRIRSTDPRARRPPNRRGTVSHACAGKSRDATA